MAHFSKGDEILDTTKEGEEGDLRFLVGNMWIELKSPNHQHEESQRLENNKENGDLYVERSETSKHEVLQMKDAKHIEKPKLNREVESKVQQVAELNQRSTSAKKEYDDLYLKYTAMIGIIQQVQKAMEDFRTEGADLKFETSPLLERIQKLLPSKGDLKQRLAGREEDNQGSRRTVGKDGLPSEYPEAVEKEARVQNSVELSLEVDMFKGEYPEACDAELQLDKAVKAKEDIAEEKMKEAKEVIKLKHELALQQNQIESLEKKLLESEKMVEALEKMVKEKEEEALIRGDEKRRAIRELCVLIEYHRQNYLSARLQRSRRT